MSYYKKNFAKNGSFKICDDIICHLSLEHLKHVFSTTYADLNPIEGQWKMFEEYTKNRQYQNVDEMQKSIHMMLRKKEIPTVKMSAYLRH